MKITFTYFFFLFSVLLIAQNKILVEYSYRNAFDTSKVKDEHLLNLYKNSNDKTFYYRLLIDGNEAVFEDVQRINNSQETEEPVISGPLGRSYTNLQTKEILYEVEYAGKYIIKDSIDQLNWVIERERGKHLGFEIRKATYKNDDLEYEAWFVPSIPIKFGPQGYGNLPGLIVKFMHYFKNQYGTHQRSYVAENIALNAKINVQKPIKGKIISQKDFNKIVEEQNKKYLELEENQVETKLD